MIETRTISMNDWFNDREYSLLSGSYPAVVVPPPQSFVGIVISVEQNHEEGLDDVLLAERASRAYEVRGIEGATTYAEYRARRSGKDF